MNKQFEILDLIKNEPNCEGNYVSLKELLISSEYAKESSPFSIPLGKDANGNIVIIDLGQLQNLLICGVTGSGKTSAIFSILIALMLRNESQSLKLVCIDSMGVDYFPFLNTKYSLFKPQEMLHDKVFKVIDFVIQETNDRLKSKRQSPKIVCVIDDFADIQTDCEFKSSNIFNDFINLIPLMNTVGIYVIFSTTRPTKFVITEKIKEIFSNRLAFAVVSSADSQVIIDEEGAENLDIRSFGTCLFKSKESIKKLRCSYISPKDVVTILKHLS